MSKKVWIIFIAACVLVLGGLVYYSNSNKLDVSQYKNMSVIEANDYNGKIADHVYGNADSPVLLVEYGDYQCPGCGQVYPTTKEISEQYKDQIGFIFRNFPLSSMHPNARAAAAAVEAGGIQGKYWEMHNSVYENQQNWQGASAEDRTGMFTGYGTELGLDGDKLKSDMASTAVAHKIDFDMALGKQAGVHATPTFYLNGQEISGDVWNDADAFKDAINAELKKHDIELPKKD
ncbi:MAG: DsbA family protein [bacterium]|nr:DsbA family protein [bacterium]MDN5835713.1 DsbA family protein [bacterium]